MKSFLTIAAVLMASAASHAFPENVRHGYVNCTSCHVAPTGGGSLTAYGRSLSAELMSTWSYKNEEGFLHGAIEEEQMPEWLSIGGDLRAVQIYKDTPQFTEQRFIKMQADIEAAVRYDKFTVDASFGRIYGQTGERWGSRRYYGMYSFTDEVSMRVGRFYPQFGLNVADHFVETRRQLGFDEAMERDNLEVAYNGENFSAFLTGSQQPGETDPRTSRETSYAGQINKNLGDSSKVGISTWWSTSNDADRKVLGLHGTFGFSKKLFLLSEFDHQWKTLGTQVGNPVERGFFAFNRLGYEITKGLIVFGQAEYGQNNLNAGATARDAYGPGLQWLPRPHFELVALARLMRTRATSSDFYSYGYMLGHYYF